MLEMITITTNTRGSTKMADKKDYAEMNAAELVAAYNKKSGKDPIKKFRDRATALARLAALDTEKAVATPKATNVAKANGSKLEEKASGSENKLAAEFGARVGSYREKLLIALDASYKKQVPVADLLKEVYGSKNTENTGALGMVIKGALGMIKKNRLPYELKKEKNEAKEISFGLFPK